jgi:CubicO group peptidase (beta-lactamase class C family)
MLDAEKPAIQFRGRSLRSWRLADFHIRRHQLISEQRMRHRSGLIPVAVYLGVVLSASARPADDPRIRQVEQGLLPIAASELGVPAKIEDRMRAYGVPGLSIAVIDGGKIVWAKGYGVADSAFGRRVTTKTMFQAASISKPISAVGALVLVQQGRLRLDEPANDALRSWKIPDNNFTRRQAVTIRMLLNHTAGLEHADSESYAPFSVGDSLPTMLEIFEGQPPARRGGITVVSLPGSAFAYSAAGYEVLQQVVTEAAGQPFGRFMQAEVLGPLGMASSTFAQPLPGRLRAVAATGYYAGGEPLPGRFRISPELTVAGLWTTPTDIAQYVINVQRACRGLAHQPLRGETAREMLHPGFGGRGLGPAISGSGQSVRFGHDGFNEGFESSFVAYQNYDQGAVVMANSGFAFMLIKEILGSISRVYGWSDYGPTSQQPPSASIQQQRVIPVHSDLLRASTGRYSLGNTKISLYYEKDRLFLDWPTNGVAEIFSTPDGRLFCPQLIFSDVGSPWLRLVRSSDGVVREILAGDAANIPFKRLD